MGIPKHILEFVDQVYPENAEFALTCFNEKVLITDATKLIVSLKQQLDRALSTPHIAMEKSLNQELVKINKELKEALSYASSDVAAVLALLKAKEWGTRLSDIDKTTVAILTDRNNRISEILKT